VDLEGTLLLLPVHMGASRVRGRNSRSVVLGLELSRRAVCRQSKASAGTAKVARARAQHAVVL
jgi:hypothetical protein